LFPFGYLKEGLTKFDCVGRDALKDAIIQIFDAINNEMLRSVFTSWIKRFKWVIRYQGEYDHESYNIREKSSEIKRENTRLRTHGPPTSQSHPMLINQPLELDHHDGGTEIKCHKKQAKSNREAAYQLGLLVPNREDQIWHPVVPRIRNGR
jgi:hypothetical protein